MSDSDHRARVDAFCDEPRTRHMLTLKLDDEISLARAYHGLTVLFQRLFPAVLSPVHLQHTPQVMPKPPSSKV